MLHLAAGLLAHAAAAPPIAVAAGPSLADADLPAVGVAHARPFEPVARALAQSCLGNGQCHICQF